MKEGIWINRLWLKRLFGLTIAIWTVPVILGTVTMCVRLWDRFIAQQTGVKVVSGRWGVLEERRIIISPPMDLIPGKNFPLPQNPWYFSNTSRQELAEFLKTAKLPVSLQESLLSNAKQDTGINGFQINPTQEEVLKLSAESRARIYNHLYCLSKLNRQQADAFRFVGQSPQEWFKNANLRPSTVRLAESLVYRNGCVLFFADWALMYDIIKDPEEMRRLQKILARAKTYQLKVKIDGRTDIYELIDYWEGGKRSKDILPILRSIKESSGNSSIDVVHLLSRLGRAMLYTYPDIDTNQDSAVSKECIWTALNFFNFPPDNTLTVDLDHIAHEVNTNYELRRSDPEYGDLAIFRFKSAIIHMGIYIADDIIYTKNGYSYYHPWMFMSIQEAKDFYPYPGPIDVSFLHKKNNSI